MWWPKTLGYCRRMCRWPPRRSKWRLLEKARGCRAMRVEQQNNDTLHCLSATFDLTFISPFAYQKSEADPRILFFITVHLIYKQLILKSLFAQLILKSFFAYIWIITPFFFSLPLFLLIFFLLPVDGLFFKSTYFEGEIPANPLQTPCNLLNGQVGPKYKEMYLHNGKMEGHLKTTYPPTPQPPTPRSLIHTLFSK